MLPSLYDAFIALSPTSRCNRIDLMVPYPSAHFARENVTAYSFREIIHSPFLQALRDHLCVLQAGEVGCALVNNHSVLEKIACETGAESSR